ncbi:MAG: type III pantothenate kinase [Alphaproteobacteria bacterium]|jgi:type III pantothenate kinase|nr:type III pantothenate kinase [Alphaproteobacteria bacterium]MDP6238659.1 type III pantothenate kinase [Alphaproteobacteria bacterium]MDP7173169.1 type III pantothenate kinase [Alphaproteobacteria bacterium]MDP7233560.1 type III pantothenate kinase [Alphaproteobacteria bacterium]
MSKKYLLAVDAGNTNVVFAIYDGEMLLDTWRTATVGNRTADEYAVWLTQLMSLRGIVPGDVGSAIIATVVPQTLYQLVRLCERYFSCEACVVDAGMNLGLNIHIDRPNEVGADRLVNAVAAHARHEGWLIVIDFGTATTLDVVSAAGDYEGGVIAPGVNLSLEALDRAAAKLPRIAVEKPEHVVGRSTLEAMQSGVYWGYVDMLEGMIQRIQDEVGEPMCVVATGGLAPLFSDATDAIDVVESDLTLFGLCRLHRMRSA